jgi:hypothetical protein
VDLIISCTNMNERHDSHENRVLQQI